MKHVSQRPWFKGRDEWRAWLAENHAKAQEMWLVFYKKHTGKPGLTYIEALEEALCFGWIQSRLKPIDREMVLRFAEKTGLVLTCENHQIVNGLGSAVAEVLGESLPTRMARLGVNEQFGQVGDVDWLRKAYGLDAEAICARARQLLECAAGSGRRAS